jgi:hypothetical protein
VGKFEKAEITINLHEIEYIEDVLTALAEVEALDCTVINVEGIPSIHEEDIGEYRSLLQLSVTGLFSNHKRNENNLIRAVVDRSRISDLEKSLKAIRLNDRCAVSFWIRPIEEYYYHKED